MEHRCGTPRACRLSFLLQQENLCPGVRQGNHCQGSVFNNSKVWICFIKPRIATHPATFNQPISPNSSTDKKELSRNYTRMLCISKKHKNVCGDWNYKMPFAANPFELYMWFSAWKATLVSKLEFYQLFLDYSFRCYWLLSLIFRDKPSDFQSFSCIFTLLPSH